MYNGCFTCKASFDEKSLGKKEEISRPNEEIKRLE